MGRNNTRSIKKSNAGRPTVMTDETVSKLESVFKLGVTDQVACTYAGISRETYYSHLEKNPLFSDKIASAKDYARIAAGSVVMDAIIKQKDVQTAKWWLEKKYPTEFGQQANNAVNVQVNNFIDKKKEEYDI